MAGLDIWRLESFQSVFTASVTVSSLITRAAAAEFASTSAMLCRCAKEMCHFGCNTSDAVNTSITSMAKVAFQDLLWLPHQCDIDVPLFFVSMGRTKVLGFRLTPHFFYTEICCDKRRLSSLDSAISISCWGRLSWFCPAQRGLLCRHWCLCAGARLVTGMGHLHSNISKCVDCRSILIHKSIS